MAGRLSSVTVPTSLDIHDFLSTMLLAGVVPRAARLSADADRYRQPRETSGPDRAFSIIIGDDQILSHAGLCESEKRVEGFPSSSHAYEALPAKHCL